MFIVVLCVRGLPVTHSSLLVCIARTTTTTNERLLLSAPHLARPTTANQNENKLVAMHTIRSRTNLVPLHHVLAKHARPKRTNERICSCTGRFLYMSTRKVYEGEWVGGTPKCGEYRDMPPVRL